jgi:hypothetical protein
MPPLADIPLGAALALVRPAAMSATEIERPKLCVRSCAACRHSAFCSRNIDDQHSYTKADLETVEARSSRRVSQTSASSQQRTSSLFWSVLLKGCRLGPMVEAKRSSDDDRLSNLDGIVFDAEVADCAVEEVEPVLAAWGGVDEPNQSSKANIKYG